MTYTTTDVLEQAPATQDESKPPRRRTRERTCDMRLIDADDLKRIVMRRDRGAVQEVDMKYDMTDIPDEELYETALEKRKNGNATARAYAAQKELADRHAVYHAHGYRNGSSKQYAYNQDYMSFETDNR